MMLLIHDLIPVLIVATLLLFIARAGRTPLWSEAYRRLRRNKVALLALGVLSLYGTVGFLDSIALPKDKTAQEQTLLDKLLSGIPVERTYSAPGASQTTGEPHPHELKGKHLLGTDGNGRDVLVRTLKGVRTALIVGGFSSVIIIALGLTLGLVAGYYGKLIDDIIQFIYTVVGSIPYILLIISLILVFGRGLNQLCFALGFTGWVGLCRLIRGETLKHRDREYVRAARSLGVSNARIMARHILPNLLPVVIISLVLGFSGLVMSETFLTFVGVGLPPEIGSWGNMIDSARSELAREPAIFWHLAASSTALFLMVLAFNIFGDALRDAIDPRLRTS